MNTYCPVRPSNRSRAARDVLGVNARNSATTSKRRSPSAPRTAPASRTSSSTSARAPSGSGRRALPRLRTVTSCLEATERANARRADRAGSADVEDARHSREPSARDGRRWRTRSLADGEHLPDVGGGAQRCGHEHRRPQCTVPSAPSSVRATPSGTPPGRSTPASASPSPSIRAASVDDVRGAVRYAVRRTARRS